MLLATCSLALTAVAATGPRAIKPLDRQQAAARPWLDSTLSVDRRTELLLAAMTLEEKAAQLWQTNYMGGVNSSTGFPGADGNLMGNASTRLAWMVQELRLGIGSQYGVGGPGCASSDPVSHAGDFPTENASCTAVWRNELQRYVVTTSRLGIPVDFTDETLHAGAHTGSIFPGPIVLGATWNTSLDEKKGPPCMRSTYVAAV